MNPAQTAEVRVWDTFVRASPWLLATVTIIDWFTDEPRWMHVWLGYAAAILVVLRVLWGFIGPEHARADFARVESGRIPKCLSMRESGALIRSGGVSDAEALF